MARGLDRNAIVDAAFAVLGEAGLQGLTVRAVAVRLGVQAPALYWHVRSKKDVLDEMSTELWRRILAEVDLRAVGADWRAGLHDFATAMRRTLLGMRDGASVFGGAYLTDARLLAGQEEGLAALAVQGFNTERAVLAWRLVYDFTLGFCIEEQDVRQAVDGRYDLDERDARIDAATHPLVAEAGRAVFADQDAAFARLLELVLDAAGSLRDAG